MLEGAPLFDKATLETYKGYQLLSQYHYTKLPLWTKATYGGWHRIYFYPLVTLSYRFYDTLVLNRPSIAGTMLLIDSGRCSLVGREGHFDTCNGQYAANDDNIIVPGMFDRWEQPDPLTYVFHVRKGVLWPQTPPMARTDREVTAEDMAWFIQKTKEGGITSSNYTDVDTIEALDRYTVKLTLKVPVADMLLNIANTSQGVFPRECFEEKDCIGSIKSVSPGPFLVKEHVINERLLLEKNPEFYLKGLPYYDGMIVLNIIDPNAVFAAFVSNQLDDATPTTVEEAFTYLDKVPGAQMQTAGGHGGVPGFMRPFMKGPVADVGVRRALSLAMDIPNMWEASNGGFHLMAPVVPREMFGVGFWYTIPQLGEWYQFNPEKAKQVLTAAGYPDGFKTSINTLNFSWYGEGIALHLQQNWKKYLNVDVSIQKLDFQAWFTSYNQEGWDGYMGQFCCWILSCWGTTDDVFAQFIPDSPQNAQKLNDPFINDIYVQQRKELDPVKRRQLLIKFEKYQLDQLYLMHTGFCSNFTIMQPFERNGASHGTMYFGALNGPTWLGMNNTDYPGYPRTSGR
ncbi:MAG: ABC transporter substrate-binding protein [Dehalococcoidia bacterium]|nr:ABC transporter substrate-binding protein [Dehalococcoidia bacterium]